MAYYFILNVRYKSIYENEDSRSIDYLCITYSISISEAVVNTHHILKVVSSKN
jgi:hypothetical protein